MTTEHKRREELMMIAEEIFEEAPVAMLVVDERYLVRHINKRAVALFGYLGAEVEICNQSIDILIPVDKIPAHQKHMEGYMKNPQPRSMGIGLEIEGRRRSGALFHCDVALTPLPRSIATQRRILVIVQPKGPHA